MLSDAQVLELERLGRRIERHVGCPQDVEWAIDRHLPEGFNVVLLQSRPETVWSRTPAKPISTNKDPMRSIVSTSECM